jgi:hypothetical protein
MTTHAVPPVRTHRTGASAVMERAAAVVGELEGVLWAARDDGEKMETVAAIESLKSQLDSIELAVVRDLDVTQGVRTLGWASTQDFVTAIAGGHKGCGKATVRLSGALEQPLFAPVAEALADGWLSTAKAHVIERAVDTLPSGEEVRSRGVQALLDEAGGVDATDLRKAARRLIELVDPDGSERRDEKAMEREERAAHLSRDLSIRDDGAGGAHIRGRCSIEDAALLKATLFPLARPRPTARPDCDSMTCDIPGCGHDGRDPRDHGARLLDALVEVCRAMQKTGLLPDSHGATARVSVTVPLEDLRNDTGSGATDTGEDLSPGTVRRMACDAELIPVVLGEDSAVLDVGRIMRLVTAAIWYALVVRDRHCRFPGCTRPPIMCHAHHLVHWVDGGVTSLDNLVLLCGHHHRLVHAGHWTIDRPSPGAFEFTPPDAVRRARGPRPDRAPPRSAPGTGAGPRD